MMGATTLSRVGLIGDVHTERDLLARAIDHLQSQKVEALLCTGDIVDGAGGPKDVDACCELLQNAKVLTVAGNHDRWLQDHEMRHLPGATHRDDLAKATLDYLSQLPASIELPTVSGLALLCHGLGDNDMAQVLAHERGAELERNEALQSLLRASRYRYIVNGHRHHAGVLNVRALVLINGGTLRRDRQPCCTMLDFEAAQATFFGLDGPEIREHARHALLRPILPPAGA
jgi:predicted phosphodiesterase